MQRVADYVAQFLVNIGIPHVFLVSGGGMMHSLDGLASNPTIKITCAHHEQAAAIMAEGYAHTKGDIGVCFVTTGPGSTNAITGVADAWVDSIPLLVISGQAKRSQNVYNSPDRKLRSIGGQEINIVPVVKPITKYAEMVNNPEDIRYHLEKAVWFAREGRPGPVWLDIPLDVQAAQIDPDILKGYPHYGTEHNSEGFRGANKNKAEWYSEGALKFLTEAKRPVIIAGHGIKLAHAQKEFLELVNTLKIPVVVSKLGQGLLDNKNRYYIGMGGTKGTRAANLTMQNADFILAIGSRLAIPFTGYDFTQFARGAKKFVVDIDEAELTKGTIKIDWMAPVDAKLFINALLDKVNNVQMDKADASYPIGDKSVWAYKCDEWTRKYPAVTADMKTQDSPINIYNFFSTLSDNLSEHATIVADAGSTYYTISQAFRVKQGQTIIVPAAFGGMGFSLPLAIGAYYADPEATVAAVTGDGSLQMNIQELQTVVHNKIPIKLFVINNGEYASIRNTQNLYFDGRKCGADKESGVSCPNLEKIAGAYGIEYISIKNIISLNAAMKYMTHSNEPVIFEVFTDPNQQTIPNVGSRVLPDGSMVSNPLEDMSPPLPRDEFYRIMVVKPIS